MLPGDGNGKVYVGIPRERIYMTQFVDNRDMILARLHHKGLDCGYWQQEGHRVDRNRDMICKQFLKHADKPEWLLMLDSDMEHPEDIAERLMRWKKPIVGGLYFHRGPTHDPFCFRAAPNEKDEWGRDGRVWAPLRDEVYDFLIGAGLPMRDGAVVVNGVDDHALLECDAVATGAMLLHRSVIEVIQPPWFEYQTGGNSEDLTFCARAKEEYGYSIYCDLSTISGHFHWVPMGQVQFRMNYENRGINVTAYTKRTAANWLAKFYGIPFEQAVKDIEVGNAHMVGDLWKQRFDGKQPSPSAEKRFYNSREVGELYIMELLHWNFTPVFNQLRQMLTYLRKISVIEIGSGIGSVALQLAIQNNKVIAVETNAILRHFTAMRYQELVENIATALGPLDILDERWMKQVPDNSIQAAVSFDTFEHLPEKTLREVMHHLSRVLEWGGKLIYHANWYQQDLYPMHHDFSSIWADILKENDLVPISTMEAVKARPQ